MSNILSYYLLKPRYACCIVYECCGDVAAGQPSASATRMAQSSEIRMRERRSARGAAGAGGRAKPRQGKGRRTGIHLLIRPRRKSPCIYFELGERGAGWGVRADADAAMPVWRQKDSPAPPATPYTIARGHRAPVSSLVGRSAALS
ncbi:hypothetical protein K1T71_001810 [Dendrolimus kikuchii]|uniref:Uncharacterized protein n=1 Tax=Dendrolimus kikuchii TaxID=765133 RepID=A0ACC1DEZ2_9NEOP|nr:hypothetical protein K1T71_001810 [Dendrolimus kikuchii]